MNLIIINLFFSIVSIVLVFTAPSGYSYNFCSLIGILFVTHNILYFYFDDKKNLVCFEFFFAIAFGLTNFIYPIFYFPTDPHVSLFVFPFNSGVINKATALAYLGYTFFFLGITKKIKLNRIEIQKPDFRFNNTIFHIFFWITLISFGLYLYFGGLDAIRSVYSGGGDIRKVGIYSYFNSLFSISCYLLAIFLFKLDKTKHLFYLSFILFFALLILSTGSRALVLGLGLIIIVSYNNNVKKINFIQVLSLVLIGSFVLFVVVNVRNTDFSEGKWFAASLTRIKLSSSFDIFMDLIVNNRNLYVLTDYGDKNQLTFFNGMLVDIFSPFPGMTNILTRTLNVPVELITGGTLPTYLQFGPDSAFGLGTNMIGESYVSFGVLGIILFCYMIGHIIKVTYYASRYNVYAYVVYYLFVSHAAFYPRAPILFNPRLIVWSLLLVAMVYSLTWYQTKKRSKEKEES
jgi:oligosaccharide repeat unit polymerase